MAAAPHDGVPVAGKWLWRLLGPLTSSDVSPGVRRLRGLTSVVLLVILWQALAAARVLNPIFFSDPLDILRAGSIYIPSSQFAQDITTTGVTFLAGLGASIVVGLVIGFGVGWFRPLEDFLDPLITLAYAAPRIALVPLFVIWFGIGLRSAIVMTFAMAVFPVIINTAAGVRTVDRDLVDLARSFGASTSQVLRTIVMPASIPPILSGVRLSVGMSLIGTIVAEFIISSGGVGYMMNNAANNFQTADVFVGLFVISLLGLLMTQGVKLVERRVDSWRVEPR